MANRRTSKRKPARLQPPPADADGLGIIDGAALAAEVDELRAELVSRVRRERARKAVREVRRELAAWLTAVRQTVYQLEVSVDELRDAVRDKHSPLYDEIEPGALTAVHAALGDVTCRLEMIFPKACGLPDPVGVAGSMRRLIDAPITSGKDGA